jgi:hypothetical protein
LLAPFFLLIRAPGDARSEGTMQEKTVFEVVRGRTGWALRRRGQSPLVEFPTQKQAVRAGVAVCRDEGLSRLLIRRDDGEVEEVDTLLHPLDGFEA